MAGGGNSNKIRIFNLFSPQRVTIIELKEIDKTNAIYLGQKYFIGADFHKLVCYNIKMKIYEK